MPFTVPDKGEGVSFDQSIMFQEYIDILVAGISGQDCVTSGCAVTAGTGLQLAVASGVVKSAGVGYTVGAATPTLGAAHATNPRFDLVVVNSSGAVAVRAGTASSTPMPPVKTANDVVLAVVYVPATLTTVLSGHIVDMRVLEPAAVAALASVDGSFRSMQVFTSSGTWTKPAGLKRVKVTVVGGGGGGGRDESLEGSNGAAGGGAGGAALKVIDASAIAATVTVTVGGGGAAATAAGGTSSFGSHCSATGGAKGDNNIGSGAAGGLGGIGSGGDLNIRGGAASHGGGTSTSYAPSSAGGSSIIGGGGKAFSTAGSHGGGGGAGAAGAAGVVIIEEFF